MAADLNLDRVSIRLGGKEIVRGISAHIPAGSFCSILGANGAGKTTLLRGITGFLPVSGGSAAVGGEQLLQLSSLERAKRIALVPQLAPPVGPLTVFEAACLGLLPTAGGNARISNDDNAMVNGTLELLGLGRLATSSCTELSGGEWRKVLVAQGLVQRTPVILLDEPTAFLDPPARKAILQAVRSRCESCGLTAVAVLHDPGLASEFADQALLMRNGEILFDGPVIQATTADRLDTLYAENRASQSRGVSL